VKRQLGSAPRKPTRTSSRRGRSRHASSSNT
jgi:hypothetical protein